jgi:hypothetical protein
MIGVSRNGRWIVNAQIGMSGVLSFVRAGGRGNPKELRLMADRGSRGSGEGES